MDIFSRLIIPAFRLGTGKKRGEKHCPLPADIGLFQKYTEREVYM